MLLLMNDSGVQKFRDPALVDFGCGRRLERLGGILVDRPLPHVQNLRQFPDLWTAATAQHISGTDSTQAVSGEKSRWFFTGPTPDPWRIEVPLTRLTLSLEVRPAPSGQIGVFLEQLEQCRWLDHVTPNNGTMLSLFAHAGAATLCMAAAGAEVVHVDASRPALALARRNAAASALTNASIRWICEDVRTFIAREVRRGARYAGVVLDPPSWGHGPKGQAFSIDRDLLPLLGDIATLLDSTGSSDTGKRSTNALILLTCHSPGWHAGRLREALASVLRCRRMESGCLTCEDDAGRLLTLGAYARQAPSV